MTPYRLPNYYPFSVCLIMGLLLVLVSELRISRPRILTRTFLGVGSKLVDALSSIGVQRGVSKGVEVCRMLPALRVGHPWNNQKAVSGVACPQGVEGSGMAGASDTLVSSWPPLAIRLCPDTPMPPHLNTFASPFVLLSVYVSVTYLSNPNLDCDKWYTLFTVGNEPLYL
jgi:hypothetical protein